jgi:hypothetical protein
MLAFFGEQHTPLLHTQVEAPGDTRNLLTLAADFPRASRSGLSASIEDNGLLDTPSVSLAELAIRVELRKPPAVSLRKQLLKPFKVWDELVNGGYPPEDGTSHHSAVGPSTTHFMDPCTIEHHLEGIVAHPACFELLINLVQQWSQGSLTVSRLELE